MAPLHHAVEWSAMSSPPTHPARLLFDQQQNAVLCSAHAGLGGWPFGSVVPYAVLPEGDAVVFLSDIAEHTRNLRVDGRACLFVADPAAAERPQAGPRVAIQVRASRPSTDDVGALETRYFERFPGAQAMRQAHGFHVWRLEVDCVRWIGGFGAMGWLSRADWSGLADPLAVHAAGIVAHMNEDHAAAVIELVAWVAAVAAVEAKIVAVDRGGYTVDATGRDGGPHIVRVPFPSFADTPDAVRHATVALLHAARRARGTVS
jgi:heme iron utilization protein